MYTPLTRHAGRSIFLWCNVLPLALFTEVGPAGTVPVTLLIAYVMLGA